MFALRTPRFLNNTSIFEFNRINFIFRRTIKVWMRRSLLIAKSSFDINSGVIYWLRDFTCNVPPCLFIRHLFSSLYLFCYSACDRFFSSFEVITVFLIFHFMMFVVFHSKEKTLSQILHLIEHNLIYYWDYYIICRG